MKLRDVMWNSFIHLNDQLLLETRKRSIAALDSEITKDGYPVEYST